MRHKKIFLMILALVLTSNLSFAQSQDEKEEKFIKMQRLRVKPPAFKFTATAGAFIGYDSNVNLSPSRKGDLFEEVLFSANVVKPWIKDSKFTFNYDLGILNYNEATNASNILNHLRFGASKKISVLDFGTGYDLDILVYPQNENDTDSGDFAFHKFFLYSRHNLTKRIFHQLLGEYGIKDYLDRKALSDTINTYQDKERLDRREVAEYSVGVSLAPQIFFRLKGRFAVNNSNCRFGDYYDYKSYTAAPSVDLRLTSNLVALTSFAYTQKNYKSRLVANETYKQEDKLSYAYLELRYYLYKSNILTLAYTYRSNNSNASAEKYNENMVSCGWQYSF